MSIIQKIVCCIFIYFIYNVYIVQYVYGHFVLYIYTVCFLYNMYKSAPGTGRYLRCASRNRMLSTVCILSVMQYARHQQQIHTRSFWCLSARQTHENAAHNRMKSKRNSNSLRHFTMVSWIFVNHRRKLLQLNESIRLSWSKQLS